MDKSLPLEIVFSKTEFLENAWYLRKNVVLCVTTIASFLAHDFLHKVGKVSFFVLLGVSLFLLSVLLLFSLLRCGICFGMIYVSIVV